MKIRAKSDSLTSPTKKLMGVAGQDCDRGCIKPEPRSQAIPSCTLTGSGLRTRLRCIITLEIKILETAIAARIWNRQFRNRYREHISVDL